jgi:hypothetical protein
MKHKVFVKKTINIFNTINEVKFSDKHNASKLFNVQNTKIRSLIDADVSQICDWCWWQRRVCLWTPSTEYIFMLYVKRFRVHPVVLVTICG